MKRSLKVVIGFVLASALAGCQTTFYEAGTTPITLSPTVVAGFEKYKQTDYPLFFAVSTNGQGYGYYTCDSIYCDPDFSGQAISICERQSQSGGLDCKIFAFERSIVWKGSITYPGKRVGLVIGNSAYPKKPVDVFRDCPKCPEMVVIPSGSFRMGDLNGDGENNEKPVRMVTIRYSFAVGKYEVTQAEWEAVMGSNPSGLKANDRPVEQVSWDDVQKFIRKLNAKTGQDYRLLSEAEWEYVARAGTTSKYPWGNSASHVYANFSRGVFSRGFESGRDRWVKTAPIGSFAPNDYGVHDMHGNVNEWTADCWHDSYIGASRDGSAWISGENCSERVLRGGSWTNYLPRNQRSAYRFPFRTDFQSNDIGFRIAKTLF